MQGRDAAPDARDILVRPMLPARLPRGWSLGGYIVEGWLRDGGMAAIYRGRGTRDGRRVAIKLQLPTTVGDARITAHFALEAEILRQMADTAQIVECHADGALEDGRRYLVLEWIDGEDLEELTDRMRNEDERPSIPRVCRIGQEIARALVTLHERGVVHRDLKPANVMVGHRADGSAAIVLVDFGIAARVADERGARSDRAVLGTSAYMPPEQRMGQPVTTAIDRYALGVILFEALSGKRVPPDHAGPDRLPRVDGLRPDVPDALAGLVHACLRRDPADRPSVAVVQARLDEILRGLEASVVGAGPVRTGQTQIAPPPSLVPARTGHTEVTLTHRDVLPVGAPEGWGPSSPSSSGDEDEAGSGPGGRARWWLAAAALLLLLVGVGWWMWTRRPSAAPDEHEPPTEPTMHATNAPSGERAHAPVSPPPEAEDARAHATLADPRRVVSGPTTTPADPRRVASGPMTTHPWVRRTTPTLTPSARACERIRSRATGAKRTRNWPEVISATRRGECWSSAVQRTTRRRLRVTAFAEQDDFVRCIAAAGRSRDAEVRARVRYCKKKVSG